MSIAPITACSASSEYGGRRSRYGSRAGGAIENSTGELDIFPRWPLPGGVTEQRGRVIGNDERDAVVPVDRAAELADGELGVEERLGRERAERDDDLRLDQLELAHQVGAARLDLFGAWIPVPRRPMLEHVRDEHIFALELNGRKDFREELTRRPHERTSGLVLRRAR